METKKIALMDRYGKEFTEGDNFKHYALGFLNSGCEVCQLDPYSISFSRNFGTIYALGEKKGDLFRNEISVLDNLSSFDIIMDLSDIVDFEFASNLSKISSLHVNPPLATYASADKRTYVQNYEGFIPKTIVSSNMNKLEETLYNVFNGTMIVKDPFGCCGKDVEKIDGSNLDLLKKLTNNGKKQVVAQKFLHFAPEGGKRIAVIGNIVDKNSYKIIHFYRRKPAEGEWKDNLSQGGSVVEVPSLRKDEIDLCLGVAAKSGLYAIGLDILDDLEEGKRIPKLIETNAVLALAFGKYPKKLELVTDFILEELV